jgi:RNA polymerase sigma-70 factor (ECF subfamily)
VTTDTRSSLLARVRDPADAAGWREFFALYEPLLQAYVRKRGVSGQDADEVVQDVLSHLVKAMPSFALQRGRGRFRTWLWRVTGNTLIDRFRRERRRTEAERAWAATTSRSEEDEEPDDWAILHQQYLLEYAKARVRARSAPRTWACFEEHLLKDRPSAEVAADLGITTNAVDVNASRVLARLREFCRLDLEGLFDGDDPLST